MSDSEDEYGPALPPGFQSTTKGNSSSSDSDTYGPALPTKSSLKPETSKKAAGQEHQSKNSSDSDSDSSSDSSDYGRSRSKRQRKIGPSIPEHILKSDTKLSDLGEEDSKCIGPVLPAHLKHLEKPSARVDKTYNDGDSDDAMIGPSACLQATGSEKTSATEFEMRAQKMHAKLTGQTQVDDTDTPTTRETWMTELPSSMGKQFGLANRTFRKNEAPEIDSSWTDTPQDRQRKEERDESGSKRKKSKHDYVPTERDRKMEKEIDEYNKVHRPDSLLAMHEKKLKKKKKKEKKKKKKKDKKPEERRPFDRDLDLQVNKLDDAQRKAIIKRSQELNSRFKTGGMGTSFL